MFRFARVITVLALLLLGLAACGTADPAATDSADRRSGEDADAPDEPEPTSHVPDVDEDGAGQPGEGLTVAAPVYPLAWVAEQIAPGATVGLLTAAGADPHDIELTPRGRQLIETADVVLHMGEIGYQPQVETAIHDSQGAVVSFAEVVGEESLRDRDDDHSHADDDDSHGSLDPHAWFDAGLMAQVSEAVGEALADVDPGAADDYRASAAALAADFREAEAHIAGLFERGCAHERVIVSHEAYAYLLAPHGLAQEGVSGVGGHGPASPQRIAQLAQAVRAEGIEYVLAEPLEGRDDALAVADEAGVEILDIFSLEVIEGGGPFEERGFLRLLIDQAETTARALACD